MVRKLLLSLALLIVSLGALQAKEVTIDVGDFSGTYNINGESQNADHSYDLDVTRSHIFSIGPGLATSFGFDTSGKLVSGNPNALFASDDKLTINTVEVSIDKGDYAGRIYVPGVLGVRMASTLPVTKLYLIPTLGDYQVAFAPGNAVGFTLDAAENVVPANDATSEGGVRKLRLKTQKYDFETGSYIGRWWIEGVTPKTVKFTGNQTINLVPGVDNYALAFGPGNNLKFDIDTQGLIDTSKTAAADELPGRNGLRLNTVPVFVDVARYNGVWQVSGMQGTNARFRGSAKVNLPRDVAGYAISFSSSNNFKFDIDARGQVDVSKTQAAEQTDLGLKFNTVSVRFNIEPYFGTWQIAGAILPGTPFTGPVSIDLVPDVENYGFYFGPSSNFEFDLRKDGTVDVEETNAAYETKDGLRLRTVPISITPESPLVKWRIERTERRSRLSGPRTIAMVSDVPRWEIKLKSGASQVFDIDFAGNPIPKEVIINDNGTPQKFSLVAEFGELNCQFSAPLTLSRDLTAQLPKGAELQLVVDAVVDLADRIIAKDTGVYAWNGSMTILDPNSNPGESIESNSGQFRIETTNNRSQFSFTLSSLSGSLGGEEISDAETTGIDLIGDAGIISSDQFVPEIAEWNKLQQRRFGNFPSFSSKAEFNVGDVSGLGCTILD